MSLDPNAALIVIDMQKGFADPGWGPRNNPDCESNVERLLESWAASARPVVLVRHDSVEESPLNPNHPGNALMDFVAAAPHELFVRKDVNSAFFGEPDLSGWLDERGIQQIVICGIQTNMCVETTARMGGNLGYEVLVPIDATHTFDLEGPGGVRLSADELSRATAVNLHGGEFATVLSTDELLERA
ncbi:cysteine hydrolase family protein [Microterricola viridarii]|uniref:Nicotinamidase-related amidase n=1 Tax=Microterricola viridarii TaxID=412690 RepID=A0A1H1XYK9_9MICO|nr:cysteine hydrolase family protein [Microterricola viridarii]SDT14273.1 Nicotinamidase-related amidase [Microterricola viridarii]